MAMVYVLLTDNDDATAMVACPDRETAEHVGAAAIWANGGVSAWLVPETAITEHEAVVELLRDGSDCGDLEELASIVVEHLP